MMSTKPSGLTFVGLSSSPDNMPFGFDPLYRYMCTSIINAAMTNSWIIYVDLVYNVLWCILFLFSFLEKKGRNIIKAKFYLPTISAGTA